jgi:4,5-dihydroxyphthalate decarboxylase
MDLLRAAVGRYPHTASLVGATTPLDDQTELLFEPLNAAGGFARILDDLRYDVFELPIVSFLVAQQQGLPIVATPLFVTRRFHHSRLLLNRSTGVNTGAELTGRSAGIRYHGFTDGTWARGVMSHEFGVDPRQVTWVTTARETVAGAPLPENVRSSRGVSLDELLLEGELSALILEAGRTLGGPGIEPMFADIPAAEEAWFRSTGVVPINHLIAVQQRVVDHHPHIVEQLIEAFSAAKTEALHKLAASAESGSEEADLVALQRFLGSDPMPYGVDANRSTLEMIIRFSLEQQVITVPTDLATVFATTPR